MAAEEGESEPPHCGGSPTPCWLWLTPTSPPAHSPSCDWTCCQEKGAQVRSAPGAPQGPQHDFLLRSRPCGPCPVERCPSEVDTPEGSQRPTLLHGGHLRGYLFMEEHPPLSQDGLSPSETPLLQREGRTQLEQVPGQS